MSNSQASILADHLSDEKQEQLAASGVLEELRSNYLKERIAMTEIALAARSLAQTIMLDVNRLDAMILAMDERASVIDAMLERCDPKLKVN